MINKKGIPVRALPGLLYDATVYEGRLTLSARVAIPRNMMSPYAEQRAEEDIQAHIHGLLYGELKECIASLASQAPGMPHLEITRALYHILKELS